MASTAAFAGQAGYVSETVPGTAVTVAKFLPILSSNLGQKIDRIPYRGHRAGRRVSHGWKPGKKDISGNVVMEFPTADVATLLRHMMGGAAAAPTGAGPYTHSFTPADLQLAKSMTWQIGRPDQAGTVQPFTYAGCKVASWEIGASIGDAVMLTLDLVGMSEVTGTALATASYTGQAPFVFTEAAVTIAGSAANVTEFTLSGDNGLNTDRYRLGSASRAEPIEASRRDYSGSVTIEFAALTDYNRFVNGTEAAMVLTCTSGTDILTVTTNVRFDGDTPELPDDGNLFLTAPFVCTSATSDAAAVTIGLVNDDSVAA